VFIHQERLLYMHAHYNGENSPGRSAESTDYRGSAVSEVATGTYIKHYNWQALEKYIWKGQSHSGPLPEQKISQMHIILQEYRLNQQIIY